MFQPNGISLHVEDHDHGKPVLLLHAIAPDLRGLGRSDRPEGTRGARPNNLTVPCEPTHKTTWRFPLWI